MMEVLSSLLAPLTPSEFSTDYYTRRPLHIGKCPGKFDNLFSWVSLNRVLNSSPVPHPTMKMVLEGKPVLVSDAKSIIERCREGASLVIEEMHRYDEHVGKLAATLSKEIGEPTKINLYLSQPSRQGYSRHYDTHDVFILQITGFKGWRVFDATVKYPLFVQKFHDQTPPQTPRLECMLEPGDVLYIPRGHWHEATAQVEPSLHLTLGIYARTGIDFLSWLVDELREDVNWRDTFPLILTGETSAIAKVSPETISHLENLKALLASKLNASSLIHDYRKFCVAQERKINPFAFPSQVFKPKKPDRDTEFSRPSYQQVFIERIADTGVIEVTVWGKVIKFSGPVEQLLRFIFSTLTFTGHDLLNATAELTWSDIATVMDCLIREDVVEVITDR